MRTKLNFSTAFHHQTNKQSKRTIKTLEDMLGSCVLEFGGHWEKHLPLIGMVPYEALCGRKCRSPIHCDEVGERKILGSEIVGQTVQAVEKIKVSMKKAKDRQKKLCR